MSLECFGRRSTRFVLRAACIEVDLGTRHLYFKGRAARLRPQARSANDDFDKDFRV